MAQYLKIITCFLILLSLFVLIKYNHKNFVTMVIGTKQQAISKLLDLLVKQDLQYNPRDIWGYLQEPVRHVWLISIDYLTLRITINKSWAKWYSKSGTAMIKVNGKGWTRTYGALLHNSIPYLTPCHIIIHQMHHNQFEKACFYR